MQDDTDALKKKVASLSLELQAARDKLAVYMRTELPGAATNTDLLFADDGGWVVQPAAAAVVVAVVLLVVLVDWGSTVPFL